MTQPVDRRHEQNERPEPCGYRIGTAVCRVPAGHLLRGIPHQPEPPERQMPEYMGAQSEKVRSEHAPHKPRKNAAEGSTNPSSSDAAQAERLGRAAFEEFQRQFGQHNGEALSWESMLVHKAEKNSPTIGRNTQRKWAEIAKAVLREAGR